MWEVLERPSSRPITIAPVTTRRDRNFNRSVPPQPFYPSFAGPQHSCPETTRRTHARDTSPPQKKIERTWRRFLESLPVPAGRWQPSLQKCGLYLNNNIANDENQCAHICFPVSTDAQPTILYCVVIVASSYKEWWGIRDRWLSMVDHSTLQVYHQLCSLVRENTVSGQHNTQYTWYDSDTLDIIEYYKLKTYKMK